MLIDDIALTLLPDVGCRTLIHLLECFGSAEHIYAATEQQLRDKGGLNESIIQRILKRESHPKAEAELEFITRHRLRVLTSDSPQYPQRLLECEDYPHVLYVRGEIDFNVGHWLSVVGTRKITPYGARMCDALIGELARQIPDLIIVSGLAYGVDVAAHRAAIKYGIPTVGILGHPINRIYPTPHTDIARRMIHLGGAVLSEFPSFDEPRRAGFVQRNRIIAGISEGTLIVESALKGGSLITADMADGYHRTLMAVPGRVGDRCSEGTNQLIRSLKAQMVCSGTDIAEGMNWDLSETNIQTSESEPPLTAKKTLRSGIHKEIGSPDKTSEQTPLQAVSPADETASRMPEHPEAEYSSKVSISYKTFDTSEETSETLSSAARQLLNLIDTEQPIEIEELTRTAPFPPADLALLLLDLECRGYIYALPGNRYLKS